MKLPFKPIAILVIISLLGIFIYQAYWITGLYKTMKHELEQSIVEAMRMSDYNEMMLRVKAMQKENKARRGFSRVQFRFRKIICPQQYNC